MDIKYPNINAPTEAGKFEQVRGYLFQLVDQLNFALNAMGGSSSSSIARQGSKASSTSKSEAEAQATFNSIKALIIKSADIVNAYYDQINSRLEGYYLAKSDFGEYIQSTTMDINGTSTSITQMFTNLQAIITEIDNLEHSLIDVNAYIRSGELYTNDAGVPVYGLEIGQTNVIDGQKVFDKFARFTSDRLSFYDQNGTEVAYISDRKLYIRSIEVLEVFKMGGIKSIVLSNGDIVEKWVK